jgi:putative heme-binding domain-containing protein
MRFLTASFLIVLLTATFAEAVTPLWLWSNASRVEQHNVVLQKSFDVNPDNQTAHLWFAHAYCGCEVLLNGHPIAHCRPYQQPTQITLTNLASGENHLTFLCHGVEGPSALAAHLQLSDTHLVTDGTWQVAQLPAAFDRPELLASAAWEPATSFGPVDVRVWNREPVTTQTADDYTQWKRALQQQQSTGAEQLEVVPGFQVERLYSAGPGEGSWISLAEDPLGRWVIGHEDTGLVRITLHKDQEATLEKLSFAAEECRGVQFADNALYAMGNNSLALFRLRDTNKDDQFDQVEQLAKFAGGVGHGRNQLTLGPDGKIYAIFGDSVEQPTGAKFHPPQPTDLDDIQKTQNGFVARTDLSSKHWEILATGLRNPYGIDFNRFGDMFTYDADAEFDMGSSWYRPTRVLHLLPGGDYGWRSVTSRWPPYDPDSATVPQPTLDIGRGSPTAVEFTSGDQFPASYRDTLFALDWSYGRILAVHLQPCGSSYAGGAEVFLRGSPLNVTDLEFGRDGAMYFVTGGRKTQSGLYRVRYVGSPPDDPLDSVQIAAVYNHAESARQVRRRLESYLASTTPDALTEAWRHLNSADPWIRHAARTVIESLPVEKWRATALQETDIDRFLAATLALQRFGNDEDRDALRVRLETMPVGQLLPWQQTEWAELCLRQLGTADADADEWDRLYHIVSTLFPSHNYRLDYLTSQFLAKRDSGIIVPSAIELLERARATGNQRVQMHWLLMLSTQSHGWTSEMRERYFAALVDMDSFEAGEGMPDFRRLIREAALAKIPADEREHWQHRFEQQTAEHIPELPPARTAVVKQWTLDDFKDVQQELARPRDLERGKQLFATARCIVCHRRGSTGGVSGPDLTDVARRFSATDLLASILTPSSVIAEKYALTTYELADGRVVSGRTTITDYRSPDIQLVPDLLQPTQTVTFPKHQIITSRASTVSPMPQGLVDVLEKEEVLDLLMYLTR